MLFSFYFHWGRILDFWVNSSFWIVSNPLSYKYFISLCKKVWPLSLSHVINPVALKVIPTTFSKNTISAPLPHKPHAFINIAIGVNHSSLTMGFTVHPHAIITISWFKKHCASSFFLVILPVTCVLSSQFIFWITYPKCPLPMSFIFTPTPFILITILIILDTESIFFIIFPITNIFMRPYPLVRFLWPIFIKRLFLHKEIRTFTQYMFECEPFFCALVSFLFHNWSLFCVFFNYI